MRVTKKLLIKIFLFKILFDDISIIDKTAIEVFLRTYFSRHLKKHVLTINSAEITQSGLYVDAESNMWENPWAVDMKMNVKNTVIEIELRHVEGSSVRFLVDFICTKTGEIRQQQRTIDFLNIKV